MKIIIAPDSFKGNLTSLQVADALEKGIHRVLPRAKCIKVPMADGGEGTVQSLVDATGGKKVRKKVTGPAGKPVNATYGIFDDGMSAIIEMAEASGLPYVSGRSKNPLKTTTYGTGELMIDAVNRGVENLIIGIGGSATNDGGSGMAQAIGIRFLNSRGREITQLGCGGILDKIAEIDMSGLDPRIRKAKITIASDVDNPLCGRRGASYVFGPQKGASLEVVRQLDANLKHFGTVFKKQTKKNIMTMPGAGAAGGLGFGLVAFAGAKMKSGVDIVMEATDLKKHLKGADLVITGEGQVDFQTAFGKTPAGVAKAAKKFRVPVVAIGGALADDANGVFEHGILGLESAVSRVATLDEALDNAPTFLANAGERVIRMLMVGKSMARKR